MNLLNDPHQDDIFDLKLKNLLKNWVASAPLPVMRKEHLLAAANSNPSPPRHKKQVVFSNLLLLIFDEHFLLRNQKEDVIFSAQRYNRNATLFGFDPRLSMHFS